MYRYEWQNKRVVIKGALCSTFPKKKIGILFESIRLLPLLNSFHIWLHIISWNGRSRFSRDGRDRRVNIVHDSTIYIWTFLFSTKIVQDHMSLISAIIYTYFCRAKNLQLKHMEMCRKFVHGYEFHIIQAYHMAIWSHCTEACIFQS